jgi:hypothetical protein
VGKNGSGFKRIGRSVCSLTTEMVHYMTIEDIKEDSKSNDDLASLATT